MNTLVSVVMPVYNSEKTVRETIQSVLNQTLNEFEFIIIDDGSTDSTRDIIDEFKDPRIIYRYQENSGISIALNNAIKMSKGKYIARIDSDDICKINRLERELNCFLRDETIALVHSSVEYIDEEGSLIGRNFVITPNFLLRKLILIGNPIAHPTVMVKKSVLVDLGGYDLSLSGLFEDYFLWARLVKKYKVKAISDVLVSYRINNFQITSRLESDLYKSIKNKIILKGYYDEAEISRLRNERENSSFGNDDKITSIKEAYYNKTYYNISGVLGRRISQFVVSSIYNFKIFFNFYIK
ncbi:glycosyltransferase [Photobacterium damselae]